MTNDSSTRQLRYDVYFRAGGRCECKMASCRHRSVLGCQEPLVEGDWDARREIADGPYVLSNVKAMCKACLEAHPEDVPNSPLECGRQEIKMQSAAWVVQVSLTRNRSGDVLPLPPADIAEPIGRRDLEGPGFSD